MPPEWFSSYSVTHMAAYNLCVALAADVELNALSTLVSMQARGWTVFGWCGLVLDGSGHFLGAFLHSKRSGAARTQAHGSRAWHDIARHGEMPGFSDEQALGPSGGPGLQPPATPGSGEAPAPIGGPGSQSPATPVTGAAGEPSPSRTSPMLETVTALGYPSRHRPQRKSVSSQYHRRPCASCHGGALEEVGQPGICRH